VASIRKRSWQTKRGELKSGWQVDYADQHGFRRRKMFSHKKNADAFALTAQLEVRDGTHVAESDSLTVAEAGENWIETAEAVDEPPLEPTTLEQYRQHLDLHIVPIIGKVKLAKLNVPVIRDFADKLRAAGRSSTMVKYVIRSLGSLLADAQERGNIVRNPVHEMRSRRHQRKNGRERRGNNLDIGVDIPTPEEIKLILQAVTGKDRVFLLTAVFSGLRASEMRGLPWKDINLRKGELKVTQRADRHRKIGPPKTEAAQRTIPLPPPVISALREWRLACPKGPLDLVFPNGKGNVEFHINIIQRVFWPAQLTAGVVVKTTDTKQGSPSLAPKYAGLHSLRHFYASWCINRKTDGGLELPPKVVQYRCGHSSITVTMDTYGHLFPRSDDTAELAEAASSLLS
jgi:integrase